MTDHQQRPSIGQTLPGSRSSFSGNSLLGMPPPQ